MKLHDVPLSGNAYKVRLFLHLLGLPVERIDIDLRSGEQKRPAFLAINPRGQVPALEDGDYRLGDSQAILVYLARRYAEPAWYPLDAETQGRIAHWLSFAANEIQHGAAAARIIQVFQRPGDLPAAQAKARETLELLDGVLRAQQWLADTAQPTIADIAVYPYVAMAGEGGVAPSAYPAVQAWLERVRALPGYLPLPAL